MVILTEKTRLKKERFIQQIFDEICDVPNYTSFHSHAFYKIAYLGLQLKARKEGLFDSGDWSDPKQREFLVGELKKFLIKYTK
ncbi:MAG: hypothetical protein ACW98D_19555 [Promethearchaeota archaeon]|jgi:hypothetical protein